MKRNEMNNMAKANKKPEKKDAVVYLEGIENKEVEKKLQEILDTVDSEMELEEAVNIFVKRANGEHATTRIETPEKRATYAYGIVKTKAKASRSFSSKPTMPISCVIRNVGGVKQNFANVTEGTRDMNSNDDKIGIGGSWRRCLDCNRKWDTADVKYGTNCPGCSSTNNVIMANQAVPTPTQGIVNRQDMRMGDISMFNKTTSSVFVYNPDDEEVEEAFLSLSGKQQLLLKKVQLGVPFDINVDEKVFVNDTTDINYFSTTGTSKVTECSVEDFPDILKIYETMESLVQDVEDLDDGDYCTLFLEVLEEAKQPKEEGKWLVQLTEPIEDESEPVLLSMYLDDEDVAAQFNEGDQGIFECRYSESTVTVGGEEEISRTINVNVETCGLPIYILSKDGTKFISA